VRTIVIALSHPDDEVLCAGAMAAHASRGDRVVALFLTRGERTEALGPIGADAVAAQRMVHAREAAGIVGAEIRFEAMADILSTASPNCEKSEAVAFLFNLWAACNCCR
jgi:LmbE family N-acetylglucosaminyl deacetylase